MSATMFFSDVKVWLLKPAVVRAAKRGNLEKVRQFLDQGVNVNTRDGYGRTALMEASREGHAELVSLLLAHGADPELESFSNTNAFQYAKNSSVYNLLIQHLNETVSQTVKNKRDNVV